MRCQSNRPAKRRQSRHCSCLNPNTPVRKRTGLLHFVASSALQSHDLLPLPFGTWDAEVRFRSGQGCRPMKKTERVRQVVSGPVVEADLQQRTEQGWKLVALEWEREVEAGEEHLPVEVPFGLRVSPDTQRLEENPEERETLVQMMELIVQEGSYSRIANELNLRGCRTREGARWTPVSVFEMLPRLIEVGPHLFRSAEWEKRKQQVVAR